MVSGNQWAPPAYCGAPHAVCRYLIGGPKPPSAAAATVGFFDQSHLNRSFRRLLGTSPGRFAGGARQAG